MIVLATHKRPDNLKRFIRAYKDTEASEPVCVLIDNTDDSYRELCRDFDSLPPSFRIHRPRSGLYAAQRANLALETYPEEPYYAILGDDCVPVTPHWDVILKERAGQWKIAYCRDGMHDHRLAAHPFIGGDLARAQGWIEPLCFKDNYGDNARMCIGRALHLLDYVPEVEIRHLHHLNGKAPPDGTYRKQSSLKEGGAIMEKWVQEEFQGTVSRIRDKLPSEFNRNRKGK